MSIIFQEMIAKSASIHASWLFYPVGAALRKKLCLLLSGTKPSDLYTGWEDFGNELNLEGPLIQVCTYLPFFTNAKTILFLVL